MHDDWQSYSDVVPKKSPNKVCEKSQTEEGMEVRKEIKGKAGPRNSDRTQGREELQNKWNRIWQKAKKDKGEKFTALWHHVYDINRLREAYFGLKRDSAAGVDGQDWKDYGKELEANLTDLSDRLKRGAYRAKPVKRVYIPKADGKQRPIGVPSLEDKLVQRSATEVLQAIYEADFKGFSYGFRPGRSQHDALDALSVAISQCKVSWVLEADIRGFFDTIDHEWLVKFLEHRIKDERVIRHVRKWLNAGVLEEGELIQVEEGTPQGGSISPLLANIYLHYVLDLWLDAWRKKEARGEVIVVRYADDFVIGLQYGDDAKSLLEELRERFRRFNLTLHEEKTRLIEFGRFARQNRDARGEAKPETFDFLGFTHICTTTRKNGRFIVQRQSKRKKVSAKLKQLYQEMRGRMHEAIPRQGAWLRSVLIGHYRYYGVPLNYEALGKFRDRVTIRWKRTLERRSEIAMINWKRMRRLSNKWLPRPRIYHPYPWERLTIRPAIRTQCGNSARLGSVRGVPC
jgi:RNA-directed DNA polymerase